MLKTLFHHLESKKLLHPKQAGFRAHHSTEVVMFAVLDELRLMADKKKPCVLVLLDLSASFDTVNHDLLLSRIREMGVQGVILQWLTSFLSGRLQRIQLADKISDVGELICGVPQGSALSPLLFNAYLQPLVEALADMECQIYNYADDTQILIQISNCTMALVQTQNILKFMVNWMTANYLKINPDKTEVLAVTSDANP